MKNRELQKNEVSTRLVVIDQEYIKKHCLEKQFWLNSWNVFEYKNFKAIVRLYKIDVKYNTYTLEMSVGCYTETADFPLDRSDFTADMFNKKLFTVFKYIMENCVSYYELTNTAAYEGYSKIDEEITEKAMQEAIEYCEEHKIEEKDLIDSIKNQYVYRADTNHAYRFLNESKTKMHPDVVAAFAYWMGLKDEANELDKIIDPKIRKRLIARYLVACQRFEAIKQGSIAEDSDL